MKQIWRKLNSWLKTPKVRLLVGVFATCALVGEAVWQWNGSALLKKILWVLWVVNSGLATAYLWWRMDDGSEEGED